MRMGRRQGEERKLQICGRDHRVTHFFLQTLEVIDLFFFFQRATNHLCVSLKSNFIYLI